MFTLLYIWIVVTCCRDAFARSCPVLCTCVLHGRSDGSAIRSVLCNDPDMSDIPRDVPADTLKLRVEKTVVRRLPALAFSYLSKLQYLWVTYNAISTLDSGSLSGLRSLRELRLDGNLLSAFPWGALQDTPALRTLALRNNRLASVPAQAAQHLHNITYLDLSSNKLATLPGELIDMWQPFSPAPRQPGFSHKVILGLQDNPWFCDCRISRLMELSRPTAATLVLLDSYLACSGPETLAGVPFQLAQLTRCVRPSVVTSATRVVSSLGSNVLLRCDATGFPTPSLTWDRIDGSLLNNTVMQESPGDGRCWSILSMSAVLYQDSGEYHCRARNTAGTAEASITLLVVGLITTTASPQRLTKVPRRETRPEVVTPSRQKITTGQPSPSTAKEEDVNNNNARTAGTRWTNQKKSVKNIQVAEVAADSIVLLWQPVGMPASLPLTIVYSPYQDMVKQTASTEVGRGRFILAGLTPATRYMACLIIDGQTQRNQCITFTTAEPEAQPSTGPSPSVVPNLGSVLAGAVVCLLLLPLISVALYKALPRHSHQAEYDREAELCNDSYVSFETLSLKQRAVGSHAGELWMCRQTQECERLLLCSSSDSQLTLGSDCSLTEYTC